MQEFAQAQLIGSKARLPIGIQNERSRRVFRFLILGLIAIPAVAAAQRPSPRKVLILHSHHFGYAWTEDIAAGIRSVFQENTLAADLHVEFMDGRRHGSLADLERLRDYYKHKFQNLKFEVIISSDNTALTFLLENHQELFPQTPVVFCGVSMIERYDLSRQPLSTGFVEITDNQETVALALKVHPQAQRVVVVSDLQSRWSDLEQAFPQRKFVFLDPQNLELSELLNRLRQIPPDSVGLLEAFFGNRFGQTFTASEVTRLISENCQFPVYGVNANTFRHGIVGGKLNDGYFQGVEAARRAVAILQGTAPESLPIVRESMNRFQFDYTQLQRWQIDPSRLPPGSLVVNRPASLYQQHAATIWIVAAFLALQSIAISVLLFNIRRRRKAEVRLRASEDNLEKAQSIAHIGSWDHNLLNGRLWWSPETYRIFGYDEERPIVSLEFFLARVHPEDCAAVLRASSEARQHAKPTALSIGSSVPTERSGWFNSTPKSSLVATAKRCAWLEPPKTLRTCARWRDSCAILKNWRRWGDWQAALHMISITCSLPLMVTAISFSTAFLLRTPCGRICWRSAGRASVLRRSHVSCWLSAASRCWSHVSST